MLLLDRDLSINEIPFGRSSATLFAATTPRYLAGFCFIKHPCPVNVPLLSLKQFSPRGSMYAGIAREVGEWINKKLLSSFYTA